MTVNTSHHPEVKLLDSMGSDLAVADAARVSFDKTSEWENESDRELIVCTGSFPDGVAVQDPAFEGKLSQADIRLIKYLAKHNHWTPFGHVTLKFRVKTSFAMARQLVKHQIGLVWNEVSRRYVQGPMSYFVPESFRMAAENVKQGSSTEVFTGAEAEEILSIYQNVVEVADSSYLRLLEMGVCAEQARFVLPLCGETEWIWTGSLAAWARVCNLRLDPHAQAEVRQVAQMIDFTVSCNWKFQHSWAALMGRA